MNIDEIATARIELVDSDTLIWCQVEVPTSMALKALHDVIQIVMGWSHSHLCGVPECRLSRHHDQHDHCPVAQYREYCV